MQVLGINTGDPLADLEVFANAFQMSFPILVEGNSVYNMYRQTGATSPYPLDYIIDQAGNVAYFKTEYDPEVMIAVIDELLGNSANLAVTPGSLDFGEVPLGRSESLLLSITNNGLGDLQIQSLTTGTPAFTVNLESLVVPPGAERSVLVTFTPENLELHTDVLTITSNDPGDPEQQVPLTGIGQDPVGVNDLPPVVLRLNNVPNPFNPSTQIQFSLPQTELVKLTIYDTQGRAVRHLINDVQFPAGEYSRTWDGRDGNGHAMSSGIYFLRLESGTEVIKHKMTLVR